jgi:EpsI family protein
MAVAAGDTGLEIRRSSRTSTVVFAVLALAAIALWPAVRALALYWRDVLDYRHGFLVAAAAIYCLYLARHRLDSIARAPSLFAAAALAVALAAWLVLFRGNSDLGQQALLPIVLWLAVMAACGLRAATAVALPLLYVWFAIPVWDLAVPALQWITVKVVVSLLHVFGIPVEIAGTHVSIPAGTFEVAESCSGKRFLVVALAVAFLGGMLENLPARRFIGLLAASALLALVANWIRVLIVIVAGHLTNMEHYLVAVEHNSLGWVIFAVMMGCLLALVWRFGRDGAAPTTAAIAAHPREQKLTPRALLPFVLLLIPLAFTLRTAASPVFASSPTLPLLLDDWQGPLPADARWHPRFVGAEADLRAAYSSGRSRVETYVGIYPGQQPGRELVYYQNTLLAPDEWSAHMAPAAARSASSGNGMEWMEASMSSGDRWLIAFQYKVGGRFTTSAAMAQVLYGLSSLTHPAWGGVWAVAARCEENCSQARASIDAFMQAHGTEFLSLIPGGEASLAPTALPPTAAAAP